MNVVALSDHNFQALSDWIGGFLVIAFIVALAVLDMKVVRSSRGRLGLVAGIVLVGLAGGSIVILRFVRLSV